MANRGRVYNPIYTNEEWALVNPENKEILNAYKLTADEMTRLIEEAINKE